MSQSNPTSIVIIAFMVLLVLISILNFRNIKVINKKVNRIKRRYDALFRMQDLDVEEILNKNSLDIMENQERIEEISKSLKIVEDLQSTTIQKVGLVNYDAFEYLTNKLSYSLCILDGNNNGFIMTSIFGREQSSSYIKTITNAKCSEKLSEEEKEALKEALMK